MGTASTQILFQIHLLKRNVWVRDLRTLVSVFKLIWILHTFKSNLKICLCKKEILKKLSPYSIVDDLCFRNFCLEKLTNSFYGPRMNISMRHMPSLFLEFKTELFTQKEKGCLDTAIPLRICWLFPPCSLKILCTLLEEKRHWHFPQPSTSQTTIPTCQARHQLFSVGIWDLLL